MPIPTPRILHPHIAVDEAICGGSPSIITTRFPVRSVVHYVLHLGFMPEELIARFPHLTFAQVHDALAYSYDNQHEIEADLAANRDEVARPPVPPA